MKENRNSINIHLLRRVLVTLGVLLLLAAGALVAAPVAYTWYDGSKPRVVYVQPNLVADFGGGADLRTADSSARTVHNKGGPVIWRVSGPGILANAKLSRATRESLSPVFTSGDTGGTMRALPGNVIVTLKAGVNVDAFSSSHGLQVVRHLFGQSYVVASPAGMESLTKANQLRLLPGVAWAMPNWWVERHTR